MYACVHVCVCTCTVASAVSGHQSAVTIERQSAIDVPAPGTEWSPLISCHSF